MVSQQRIIIHSLELGYFQLPILVLSTSSASHMLMETDNHNKEKYIKINQTYTLKSSDSILTELGYDDFSKLDNTIANSLLQIYIAQQSVFDRIIDRHIAKDIIEEALNITIADSDYKQISTLFNESNQVSSMQHLSRIQSIPEVPMSPSLGSHGLNAIFSAAQRLESLSLPGISQITPP